MQDSLTSIATDRCEAAENTRKENRLVGCLVGKGATEVEFPKQSPELRRSFFPCPMPHNQNRWVMGFYIITDIWKQAAREAVGRTEDGKRKKPIMVTMVRLERWKLEEKAWFASPDASHNPPPLSARDFNTKAEVEQCWKCHESGPRMFDELFLCRNEHCEEFWRDQGQLVTRELTYTELYLKQRQKREPDGWRPYGAYKGGSEFPAIAEYFPDWWQKNYKAVENEPITKENFEKRMKDLNKGFWCPNCGMLNRRLKWDEWVCANGKCTFPPQQGHPSIMSAAQVVQIGKTKLPDWSIKPEETGYVGKEDIGDYIAHNFDLRHGCGVSVLYPKEGTNAKHQNSDWLLDRFQRLASDGQIDLQKQFVETPVPGTVTDHFIHNFGRPYKLAVDIRQQTSFEDGPEELRIARDFANSICRRYQLPPGAEDFNECYIAGYFTDNHMGWHADGEQGLGSVVATWTLGGEGRMFIGANVEQHTGRQSGKGQSIVEEDLVLVGAKKEEWRQNRKQQLDADLAAALTEDARETIMEQYREDLDNELDKRPGKPSPYQTIKIPLTHGSIVVMHGKMMQTYYRHKVDVLTPFRVALTFRQITDDNVNAKGTSKMPEELPHFQSQEYLKEFSGDAEDGVGNGNGNRADNDNDKGKGKGKAQPRAKTQAQPSGVTGKRRKGVKSDDDMSEDDDKSGKAGKGASKKKGDNKDALSTKRKRKDEDDDDNDESSVGSKNVRPAKQLRLTLRGGGK